VYFFKRICLFTCCIIWGYTVFAQHVVCDSILSLPVSRQQIDLLLEQTIYRKELKGYALKALEISEEEQYDEGIMHALDQLGVMERNDSNYAEALVYHNRCFALAESQQAEYWLLRSYINLGVVYRRINMYEEGLQNFLHAFHLAEKLKNDKEIASCLGNIGTLYLSLRKIDEAMGYFRMSLDKAVEMNNYQGLAISYGSMGRVFEIWNMPDSAQYCYEQNLYYSTGWNDNNGIAISYGSLGNVAKKRGELSKALDYYQKALEMSIVVGDRNYIAPNYANLGALCLQLDDTDNAEKNYRLSLQTAQDVGLKSVMAEALGGLSATYEKQNRLKEALEASRRQMLLKDSVLNEENLQRIEYLKIAFEVQQKEQTIAALQVMNQIEQLKNKQKQTALLISFGMFVVLLLFITLYARYIRQKRLFAEQRILQFEQEKQLVATQSVLDGETRERTRLARDLHDSLGSMLMGVKLNLLEMKQGAMLSYADVGRFDKALGLLDKSVHEMRRVAHHLMPDSLSRFGLKSAVNDFCGNLPTVRFSYYGDESRLNPKLEVMIYYCIHEMVNNALKHAGAENIMVQIVRKPDQISFTVQDDGCGFDTSALPQGMGLENIRTRVAAYNGILDIDSKAGVGTEINVDISLT